MLWRTEIIVFETFTIIVLLAKSSYKRSQNKSMQVDSCIRKQNQKIIRKLTKL